MPCSCFWCVKMNQSVIVQQNVFISLRLNQNRADCNGTCVLAASQFFASANLPPVADVMIQ